MSQEDALATAHDGTAVTTNVVADDGDVDVDASGDEDMDDDMMDKISSSPSIEDEDIDFEFVYALHTFVATVEGQANATKGDTMVLLDDTNSYWWLVRVVKDSSIGYLPAEHIETPTERLARLNKHRNIDLSATMLGDQADKAKTSIKTAIRRRKKTVAFASPTYFDYSDNDYSTDEEEGEGDSPSQQQGEQDQQSSSQQSMSDDMEEDESAKVQPLKPRSQKQAKPEPSKAEQADDTAIVGQEEGRRSSDDMFDGKVERTTRNGTVRNTDSFFKDETIETKKITLTPGLLRDDNEPRGSNDSKEVRQRPSFERELVADKKDDKKKKEKDKKEKDKKPSAIRSFFSRKDRKKSIDEDDDSSGKRSLDASIEITDRDMADEHHSTDMDSSPESTSSPQRHGGKLQKPQSGHKLAITTQSLGMERTPLAAEVRTNNVANVPPATLRMVESEQLQSPEKVSPTKEEKAKAAISKILPSSEARPPKVTKAKSRVELDDFDSTEEDEATPPEPSRSPPEPQRQPSEEKLVRPSLPGAFPDSYTSNPPAGTQQGEPANSTPAEERIPESPIQTSPVGLSNPPALTADTSSQEDRSSPVSSPSPEPAGADSRATHRNQDSTTTSTSTTTTSTWNDANLRAFFDSGSDIRDLLVVVYDKTDVQPASPEHPATSSLFREQNAKLAEITTQLDNMLGDWLARKQRLRGTV
ncbi:hypothetical protein F4810DRAFT_8155 [Camillea tinctor]|nr:hypothetical protein F4810DRAFT_8155 [Camillea tinctor]